MVTHHDSFLVKSKKLEERIENSIPEFGINNFGFKNVK